MEIRNPIRTFVARELLGVEDLTDTDDLLARGVDSLGILRLTVFLEDAFQIKVPDEAVVPENVRSIDRLVRLVESLQ